MHLPPDLQRAQQAIAKPEVQAMIERLSAHGLGVYMLHAHCADCSFTALADDMIQIESEQYVMFEHIDTPRPAQSVAVGWRWLGGRVQTFAECYCWGPPPPTAPRMKELTQFMTC
jgi:hypothetical protein